MSNNPFRHTTNFEHILSKNRKSLESFEYPQHKASGFNKNFKNMKSAHFRSCEISYILCIFCQRQQMGKVICCRCVKMLLHVGNGLTLSLIR